MNMLRGVLVAVLVLVPGAVWAHCDTLDGPVVQAARAAFAQRDLTPVLRWVQPADEAEIRSAFAQAQAVRGHGGEAAALAERWFFETLVRVHRAGEGAPYTGLKPAGQVEPIVALADAALAGGSADAMVAKILQHVEHGIRERFERALTARQQADESVAAGRKFVAAYVEYVHYVEGIHTAVKGAAGHGHDAPAAEPAEHREAAPAPAHRH